MNIKKGLVIVFLLSIAVGLFSQEKIDLSNNPAYSFYLLEEYQQAIDLAESKLVEFPKDLAYHYVAGISLYKINGDVNRAISHLEFASADSSSPIDAYHYLGILYRKSYQFDKSIKALSQFKELCTVNQRQTTDINKEIATSKNGKTLTSYVSDITVLANDTIDNFEFFLYYSVMPSDYKLVYAPESLLGFGDKENKHKPIICLPKNPVNGNKVVFSSYGKNPNNSKNLYIIEYKGEGVWSKPEALPPTINSREDEDYPFLSKDGKTLYFSSKGLFSLGGYDIFESHYNNVNDCWSEPESMDFPINSPFDDILFVTNSDNTIANFASKREANTDKYNLYKIQVVKNLIKRQPVNYNEILLLSKLEKPRPENTIPTLKIEEEIDFSSVSVEKEDNSSFDELYNQKLDIALSYQMKADSIRRIVDEMRIALSKKKNGTGTSFEKSKIEDLEKQIFSIQGMADEAYKDVRSIEEKQFKQKNLADKNLATVRNIPLCYVENIKQSKVIADLELKYRLATSSLENVMAGNLTFYSLNSLNKSISDLAVSLQRLSESKNSEVAFNSDKTQKALQLIMTGQGIINNSGKDDKYSKKDVENVLKGIKLKFDALKIFESQICGSSENVISIKGINILDKLIYGLQAAVIESNKKPVKSEIDNQITIQIEEDQNIDFEFLDTAYYSKSNPIPENIEFPKGLVYTIQLGVFNNAPSYNVFSGIKPIICEISSTGKRKYLAGMVDNFKKASEALPIVRKNGFTHAFIVPYYNGTKIQLSRAKLLESEVVEAQTVNSGSYKIQVYASTEALSNKELEELTNIIENKTLFKYKNPKGLYIYNVGNFNSKEKAQVFLNLLLNKGYTSAQIVEHN